MKGKKVIICIVGPSGSGKTTMGRFLCEKTGYNWICSYTTRPMRDNEMDGVDHRFVDESCMPCKDAMMAYTLFGNYHYWTTFDQFDDNRPNVYIIDEKGVVEMERIIREKELDGYELLKVYVKRSNIDVDEERIKRDDDRDLLPDEIYDLIIENNETLEKFLENSIKIIRELVRNI